MKCDAGLLVALHTGLMWRGRSKSMIDRRGIMSWERLKSWEFCENESACLTRSAPCRCRSIHTIALHSQAVVLCRRTLNDSDRPGSERAIALCWLGHLVGDAHQPCHVGSLYVEGDFPEGDRGQTVFQRNKTKTCTPYGTAYLASVLVLPPPQTGGRDCKRTCSRIPRHYRNPDEAWTRRADNGWPKAEKRPRRTFIPPKLFKQLPAAARIQAAAPKSSFSMKPISKTQDASRKSVPSKLVSTRRVMARRT